MDHFVDLDVVGAIEGADKSSSFRFGWDYLRHYEALFTPFRNQAIHVVEIGVQRGPSLRTWEWFFPHATITGVDIDPDCARHANARVHIEIGSQDDPAVLARVCARGTPTVVVDDGSHKPEHQISTFETLFPQLAPGGIYVVEDVFPHRGPTPRQDGTNAPEYFLDVARRCFARGHVRPGAAVPDAVAGQVDRVTFLGYAVAIQKRSESRDTERGLATASAYLKDTRFLARQRENLAEWILRHDGPAARALEEIEAALKPGRDTDRTRLLHAEALLRTGDAAQARAILNSVAASGPAKHATLLDLARVQLASGDSEAAMASRNAAYATLPMPADVRRGFEALFGTNEAAAAGPV